MSTRRLFLLILPTVLLCASVVPAGQGDVKSGPQVGDNLPGPMHSLVVYSGNRDLPGKKTDFFEKYGQGPVVLIFARHMSTPLTSLVKRLDAEVVKGKAARLSAVMILLSDHDADEMNLKDFGEKQALKHVNLAVMQPAGPKRYKLSKEADVTVVMYQRRKVEANHAFRTDELTEKAVERIVADVPKIASRR